MYFAAVDGGQVEDAVATMSESCIYARPPLPSADGQALPLMEALVGRPAVRAFLERRGPLALVHDIYSVVADRRRCCVQGGARYLDAATAPPSVFMAHADLDDEGLITRFLALSATVDRWTAERLASPVDRT